MNAKNTSNTHGNALIVALVMVVAISGFVAVAYEATDRSARLADRSRDFAAAQALAEGAVEYGFGVWKGQLAAVNGPVSSSAFATISSAAPSVVGFSYAAPLEIDTVDAYGAITAALSPVMVDMANYPGWRGRTYNYCARAIVQQNQQATSGRPIVIGVKRNFQYSEVPLFQAMYFYEHDFEIYKPADMIISGLVHTNSNAYVSGQNGSNLTFQSNVSFVGDYSENAPPTGALWSSPTGLLPPIFPNGKANQLSEVPRMEPLGTDPIGVLNTADANPNNDSFREIIEPPNSSFSDPSEIATRRLYHKAGLRVNINSGTITVTGANGLTLSAAKQTEVRNAVSASATIFDQREGRNVDVRSVDVGAVRTALSSGVSGFNGVFYINDTTPTSGSDPEPKTVRLKNGGVLPDAGLTVVSENPIYIQGDYNTGTTADPNAVPSNNGGNPSNTDSPTVAGYTRKPAAVIGDAVMLLSNSWSDGNSSLALSNRVATHTTFNTAIISGFMPSGYQPASGSQYGYSGGANNFPRFLETWTNQSCTYFGSMVELFQSKTFTGRWDTGVIYRPPQRRWNYDTSFSNEPPPGSVSGTAWARGSWAKLYPPNL